MEIKTLLDNNRSRNIEIFLPRFPLSLDSLESTLSEQLNNVNDSLELGSDHIVALKRFGLVSTAARCCVYSVTLHYRYQPTEEDKEMYKNYKGDKSLLQQADIFLMKVLYQLEVPMIIIPDL